MVVDEKCFGPGDRFLKFKSPCGLPDVLTFTIIPHLASDDPDFEPDESTGDPWKLNFLDVGEEDDAEDRTWDVEADTTKISSQRYNDLLAFGTFCFKKQWKARTNMPLFRVARVENRFPVYVERTGRPPPRDPALPSIGVRLPTGESSSEEDGSSSGEKESSSRDGGFSDGEEGSSDADEEPSEGGEFWSGI